VAHGRPEPPTATESEGIECYCGQVQVQSMFTSVGSSTAIVSSLRVFGGRLCHSVPGAGGWQWLPSNGLLRVTPDVTHSRFLEVAYGQCWCSSSLNRGMNCTKSRKAPTPATLWSALSLHHGRCSERELRLFQGGHRQDDKHWPGLLIIHVLCVETMPPTSNGMDHIIERIRGQLLGLEGPGHASPG
jgi:hypothetical protein